MAKRIQRKAGTSRAAGARASARTTRTTKTTKTAKRTSPRTASTPTLLTGGNPQIPKGDGDAPVRAYINATPGWKQHIVKRIDAIVVEAVPGVRKAVRWNSPFYGVEGMGWFLNIHCLTKYVKVGFFSGASLTPMPPIESKVPDVRYVHYVEGEAIDEALLGSWIRQAARLLGMTCF